MELRRKILQKLADYIISILEKEKDERVFDFYFNIGIKINAYAVSRGIYLD